MNAEQMLERNKRIAEMTRLMETPLDPNLDYFDATGALTAIGEHVRGLHKLLQFYGTTIVNQGQAIIEMRQRQLLQQSAIETLANIVGAERAEEGTGLVGFDKPKIVTN